jgi:hypothetical protein
MGGGAESTLVAKQTKNKQQKTPMKNPIKTSARIRFHGGIIPMSVSIAWLALAGAASGQQIYSTQFENPPFLTGYTLVGQDGWVAPPIFNPNAAVISADQPRQGKQSVEVRGANLEHSDLVNELTGGYYDTVGSYRRAVNFDTGGPLKVRVSTHVRIDGPETPGVNFFSVALSVRAAVLDAEGNVIDTAGVGQIDLSSDGYAYGNDGNHNVPVFLSSAPITLGQWHELAIVEDFAARTFTLSVDDQPLGTFSFPEDVNSNILVRGALLVFAAPDTGSLSKAGYAAHYDKFNLSVAGKTGGF